MDKRPRMLKSKPSSEPTNNNFVDSYYPNRPSAFESFSLYNIAINFRIRGPNSKSFLNDEPSDNTDIALPPHESQQDVLSPLFRHQVKSFKVDRFNVKLDLVKQHAARFYIPEHNDSDPRSSEGFYRRMCLLFVPWRSESEILSTYGLDTYFETFPTI
ncbi:hypothetical protein GCK72_008260 [Caenorhabditis remanei]|uniref:Uncharacterized protein n=1 Tax=Caenorhabditis remanei TaxID=31234 RepID=A0A6A5GZR1_CAERE|nr:hypothetical protein GCK72_008260 [Caenorhabditis remanei]KAF1760014.1 hypothetical protein GCK72_008260 [Caenorhabditis remanei]